MENEEGKPEIASSDAADTPVDAERRQALRKLAVYGAYTAPALLAMLKADKAAAQRSVVICDARLKQAVSHVATRDDGLRLYSFNYLGDERRFIGPLAQDLLAQPQFAGSVGTHPSGYHCVDLAALGPEMPDVAGMQNAGARAMAIAPQLR